MVVGDHVEKLGIDLKITQIYTPREQYIRRCADDLYKWQQEHRPASEPFTIHDGPPYANGTLHTGHALNKILKDIILRVKVQQGRRVTYIPGWDCHGLPIELKAVGVSGGKDMTPVQIRDSARALASKTVLEQMKDFKTYGVMADWDRRWTTMDKEYEIKQLQLFQKMVRRGVIYRKYRPVYWSPSSGTALAEAELEYNENHVSTSAYIRFPIAGEWRRTLAMEGFAGDLYAVIWTTTPWTLPGNRAIAIHDELDYSIVRVGEDALIVGNSCLESVREACFKDGAEWEILQTVTGDRLRELQYVNVLRGKGTFPQPIIHGPFVSADSGSGLVHCAPGHGLDDYDVCTRLGIPVAAPVDNDGLFTKEAYPDDPKQLEGASVLKGGSKAVLGLLEADVLAVQKYKHKYPYDWRTKQPVITRATAQWFADVATITGPALEALEDVRFIPEVGRKRLEAFVKGRNEWCISRQRAWGVPIPALYDTKGNAVMTDETIEHIISVIQERGIDAWWSDDAADPAWIPQSLREKDGGYTRGTDTMDVWFDSGSSWTQTGNIQADVYLEGSDQHRGWFQSSLLTRVASIAANNSPVNATQVGLSPFKTLVTHGFTLDQDGKKMSKSLGNVITGDQVMDGSLLPPLKIKKKGGKAPPVQDALGPDALRLWVASSDYTTDVIIGEAVLKSIHQSLLKYRTIIKMLLGSMHPAARTAPLTALDQIAIHQLGDVMKEVAALYDNFEFHKAFAALNRWVTNDLSAFYMEALKDRLYCADGGGVLEQIFVGFSRMLAPITPLLVEEAWEHAPTWLKDDPSVVHPLQQLYSSPLIDSSRLTLDEPELRKAIPVLMSTHAAIKAASERARAEKVLGSSLQCSVILEVPEGETLSSLRALADELDTVFVVSSVDLNVAVPESDWGFSEAFEANGSKCLAWVLPPKQSKCPRCWRYVAPSEDELCQRCDEVVAKL